MTGQQDTDDDSIDSTGVFATDADCEDFEVDSFDDSSDCYDDDLIPLASPMMRSALRLNPKVIPFSIKHVFSINLTFHLLHCFFISFVRT